MPPCSDDITTLNMSIFRLCFLVGSVSATCYFPNGNVARDYLPCGSSSAFTTCCLPAYSCLSNNICTFIPLTHEPEKTIDYVRGACTDQSWNSSACPQFCRNGAPPFRDQLGNSQSMSRCSSRKDDVYYCGDDNYLNTDCAKGVNVVSFSGTPSIVTLLPSASNVSSPTSTSSSRSANTVSSLKITPSPSSATSATASVMTNYPDGFSNTSPETFYSRPTSKALIITLVTVFGVLIVGVVSGVAIFIIYRRRTRKESNSTANSGSPGSGRGNYKTDKVAPQLPPLGQGSSSKIPPPRLVPLSARTTEIGDLRGPIGIEEAFAPRLVPKSARTTDVGVVVVNGEVMPPPRLVPPSARTTDIGVSQNQRTGFYE